MNDVLGEFEALVLMAVMRLGANAYGGSIHQHISLEASRQCTSGALYTTIARLEEKGYLQSRIGDPTPERGGRAKNLLQVTKSGKKVLRESHASAQRLADGVAELTLESDIQKILQIIALPLKYSDIIEKLGQLGWAVLDCDEPTRVLDSALARLVADGLVKTTTAGGEAAWVARQAVIVKGALGEQGNTICRPGGFN